MGVVRVDLAGLDGCALREDGCGPGLRWVCLEKGWVWTWLEMGVA